MRESPARPRRGERCRWALPGLVLALALASAAQAGEPAPRVTAYRIQTTATVDVTIPIASANPARVLYRTAAGIWEPARAEAVGAGLRVRVDSAMLAAGRTLLVLDPPDDVQLDDADPPTLVQCLLDGAAVDTGPLLDLGGIEKPPQAVSLRIRDEQNALAPETLAVSLNGTRIDAGAGAVRLELAGPKEAALTLDLSRLALGNAVRTTLSLSIADRSLEAPPLVWSLAFRLAPACQLPDGSTLSVDTVTTSAGWESWQVIADGKPMNAGDGTTAGRTWLSEENDRPHWVRLAFPTPRTVTGVALWWAYYECFRTSVAYEVQTWDGTQWVTQASVREQAESQCSRHTFPAVTTSALRVWQSPGSGHPERAGYMWLAEFEVF